MPMTKKHNTKFVRKMRIYLKQLQALIPFCWIEFLEDGSFSVGIMSNNVKFIEYGSAIQNNLKFKNHLKTITRGDIKVEKAKAPHYSFHPPKIHQSSGVVHLIDSNKKRVDEWKLDWFPVKGTNHILTLYSGRFACLGTVSKTKLNHSIIPLSSNIESIRMDMFLTPIGSNVAFDPSAINTVYGGCRYYNIICSFYEDQEDALCFYIANEM